MSNWCARLLLSSFVLLALGACTDSGGQTEPSPILGDGGSSPESGGGEDGDSAVGSDYSVAAMLTAYVDEIVMPNYEAVASMATEMTAPDGALANYCGAIGSGEETDAQSAVRQAWGELATSIQKAELHAIGPAAANSSSLQFRLNSYMFGSLPSD